MNIHCEHLRAVVLDWAGTTIDYGSCAPAIVFQKIFAARGIDVSLQQAREPMGMAKREHIAAVAAIPDIARKWQQRWDRSWDESDIDAMYAEFLPLQLSVLGQYSELIPGAAGAVSAMREMGLKIGSSTGYTRALMEVVSAAARQQGYEPDCVLCAEDAPRGRPAPYLLFEAAKRLDVYPMWRIVKVDDTVVGIEAGINAGSWTIGISKTGNGVGLSQLEWDSLSDTESAQKLRDAENALRSAGAQYIVESIADVPAVLMEIEQRVGRGERPQ